MWQNYSENLLGREILAFFWNEPSFGKGFLHEFYYFFFVEGNRPRVKFVERFAGEASVKNFFCSWKSAFALTVIALPASVGVFTEIAQNVLLATVVF